MARIYEFPGTSGRVDVEGSEFTRFDPVSRGALWRFWLSALGVLTAAVILYLLSHRIVLPGRSLGAAMIAAGLALTLLFVMNRALRRIRVVSRDEVKIDRRIDQVLEQLDDRFAVFNWVSAGDTMIDHLIVGPTGTYSVKSSATLDKDGWARAGDVAQALEERDAVQKLLNDIAPEMKVRVEPVLCVPAGSTVRVGGDDKGVWVVPAERMAAALVQRSAQQGAITTNVTETGAFSASTLQSAAIERALANHWNIPTRKTRENYMPPPELTGEEPAGAGA